MSYHPEGNSLLRSDWVSYSFPYEHANGRPGLSFFLFLNIYLFIICMERDDIPLEEAFAAYSAGMAVLKQCNDQIDKVEKQVLKLTEEGELEEFGNGRISI